MRELAEEVGVQEMAVVTWSHDEAARRKSYELIAREFGLPASTPAAAAAPA